MLMAASMSQTMATAPRMIRTISMLARRPEIPPPVDAHWFYMVIVLLIVAVIAMVVLAAGLLN